MTVQRQEKGFKGTAVIDFETSFNSPPAAGSRKGFRVPIKSNAISASAKLVADATLTGRRDSVQPDVGNVDVSGALKVPVDAHSFGLHLKAMFGAPVTTTAVPAVHLDATAAVDKGNGLVGLPCTGHGLAVGAPIVVAGSTHYDGAYVLSAGTSTNELVIAKTYAAETFLGTVSVTLARQLHLVGAVRDAGGGKVGLPCAAHGLPVGAQIVVSGSTHFDATYIVQRGTSTDELLVTATYSAETFSAGSVTATCGFWDRVFKVLDTMPSIVVEKAFPGIPRYYASRGIRISKLGLSFGGEGATEASMDVMGAGEDDDSIAYDAAAISLPLHKFSQKHVTLFEGGIAYSDRVKTLTLNIDFGLDGDTYTINTPDKAGERGDINEGELKIDGDLEALFKGVDLVNKAVASTISSLTVLAVREGYQLQFDVPELVYERATPSIDGPKGVLEKHKYQGFYANNSANSSIVIRLRNEMQTLEV
ncbi:phage tail tube protein [Humidesulfovibrio idahonensis]